jgi:hypothetical protein
MLRVARREDVPLIVAFTHAAKRRARFALSTLHVYRRALKNSLNNSTASFSPIPP